MPPRSLVALTATVIGLYVLLPGHPLGLLRGVPLDWLGAGSFHLELVRVGDEVDG